MMKVRVRNLIPQFLDEPGHGLFHIVWFGRREVTENEIRKFNNLHKENGKDRTCFADDVWFIVSPLQ